jgi:Uma2 family endonuclease
MTTTTAGKTRANAPAPHEVPGPFTALPSLDDLERLTGVPDRRVIFRGVNWNFYESLVNSIPESSRMQIDYDGEDLEIMVRGRDHERYKARLARIVEILADEFEIPCDALSESTWKRPDLNRGLEADESYYFQVEKLAAAAAADARQSKDIADYPNPDLAIEVDISAPQIDRAAIYAAMKVVEVWRFDGDELVIEILTAEGNYAPVDASSFLPVRADQVEKWILGDYSLNVIAWSRRVRGEIRGLKP